MLKSFPIAGLSLALLTASLFTGLSAVADEGARMKVIVAGHDAETLEIDDLEVGESREVFTESGKRIVATRTEDGLSLNVDGKDIELLGHGGGTKSLQILDDLGIDLDAEGGGDRHIVLHRHSDGSGGHGELRIDGLGLDDGQVIVLGEPEDGAGDTRVFHYRIDSGHPDPVEYLLQEGVLDELGEADRQRIVEALEAYQTGAGDRQVFVFRTDGDS